ncbi:hypothetical protein LPB140_04770 [Sphingorhabdus lutea]|uniref:Fe/B12 periplasmic-binding domain-containing protein n=1 Tax=Sphingorhabdus lutea TaxID=1913578 RepID=A0A1L3JAS6_9SPHN|nr:ABC transporter substrate-binding protein [Sphingorhabdus lutea]APG62226.1 hypothetical protein LPB140_04770 [Sphingorhabdus lutea]
MTFGRHILFFIGCISLSGCGAPNDAALPKTAVVSENAVKPQKIISINPCIDAILIKVAEPSQIAAISHYSKNPVSSSISAQDAAKYPAIGDNIEEIIAKKPDMVFATFASPQMENTLSKAGIKIISLSIPQSIDESKEQIRQIADAVHGKARGEGVIKQIDDAIASAAPNSMAAYGQDAPKHIDALIWGGGGLVPGKGTLIDDMMAKAGLNNYSSQYGLDQWDILPLEYLVQQPPAIFFNSAKQRGQTGQNGTIGQDDAARISGHRVLNMLASKMQVERFEPKLLSCGGPNIIEAMAVFRDARNKYEGLK